MILNHSEFEQKRILLNAIRQSIDVGVYEKVQSKTGVYPNDTYEIKLTLQGIEIDLIEFSKALESQVENKASLLAHDIAAAKINEYKTKHSKAAKIEKIKEQLDKLNNNLLHIHKSIQNIDEI